MIDSNFDPYEMLLQNQQQSQQAIKNTIELAKAMNSQDILLQDLVNQHRHVIELIRNLRRDIEQIKRIQNETLDSIRTITSQSGHS